jgi:hypothetical protein
MNMKGSNVFSHVKLNAMSTIDKRKSCTFKMMLDAHFNLSLEALKQGCDCFFVANASAINRQQASFFRKEGGNSLSIK